MKINSQGRSPDIGALVLAAVGWSFFLIAIWPTFWGCRAESGIWERGAAVVEAAPEDEAFEEIECGSIRSDINAASYRVSKSAAEVDKAAKWAATILSRFNNEGLDVSCGPLVIHIGFPEQEKVE